MKRVIRVAPEDRAKAWGLLIRQSAGTALRDLTFVVSEEAIQAFEPAGVRWADAVEIDVRML